MGAGLVSFLGMAKKKKGSQVLILVGLLALGAFWLFSQTKRISVGGAATRIHKITGSGIELRVLMQVINESSLDLDVYGFLGQIFFQKTAIGLVQQLEPVKLAAYATGSLEYKADISFASLLSLGVDIYGILAGDMSNWKKVPLQDFTIKGTLRAEGFDIPINQPLLTA